MESTLYKIIENQTIIMINLSEIIKRMSSSPTTANISGRNDDSGGDSSENQSSEGIEQNNSSESDNSFKSEDLNSSFKSEELNSSSKSEELNELSEMFKNEEERRNRTVQEVLDIGRNVGKEPIQFYTKKGGGYATMLDIEETKEKSKEFQVKRLSRADELEIIQTFRNIEGMNYWNAKEIVEKEGYSLHPVYINGRKNKCPTYNASILGVKVKNPDGTGKLPSKCAEIIEIINVGGCRRIQ